MASSEVVIPKERLSAYQRWELSALMADAGGAAANGDHGSPAAAKMATEREAESLREAARSEGYAKGHEAGLAQAEADCARLAKLLKTLAANVGEYEQHLVDEVLDLSLVLARQLVGEALSVRRELVLPVVTAALKQLPQSVSRVQLMLNPADMALVSALVAADAIGARCQLVADVAIAPGGCRIETEQCEIDATLPARWRRLLANLGRSDDWLEPA